ncbi:methyl-accepting chemotaxis protein [Motiliproteus sp. MSK22-1]|uniref:methyl-accepting chemotaxis protein n=1 Tax=Motiliproteus sp. MSK22-1 TaxID=1897630 RepID=UPI0009755B22|nr:methyl-accepting chemotaxis protein [Motiliproteus sp. MSK22-1]OMH37956.1 hypothetical protein BGP75_06620 [Motiliproteus sp. MSK22-1]
MSFVSDFFSRFSIRSLILGNSLLLLILLGISSGYSIFSMNQIGQELEGIAEQDIPLTEAITLITEHQLEQTIHLERVLRHGQRLTSGDSGAINAVNDEIVAFDRISSQVDQEIKQSEESAKEAISHAHNTEELEQFTNLLKVLESIEVQHKAFEKHGHELFEMIKQRQTKALATMTVEIEQEADKLTRELESLLHEISEFTERAAHQAELHEQSAVRVLSVILFVSTILGVLATYIIIRTVWTQIGLEPKAMNSLSQRIADGDLSMNISSTGRELGVFSSMIQMVSNLKRLIKEIHGGAEHVSESSRNLVVIAEQTNHNLSSQHQNTELVATAITQMTAAVEEVARNTTSAADAAESARYQLNEGGELVENTVQGIKDLSRQLDQTMTDIGQLEQGAEKITGILDVIKGIADQTNLLALNAAIEAARAGEQGRGFAVVADEVRSLAKSTQESASEIEEMILGLQSSASSSINSMRVGSDQANKLLTQSGQVTNALEQIQQTVADISDMNAQIASAAEQQKAVSADISQNVNQISVMSKETREDSEKLSVTSEELAQLAKGLLESTERFKIAG